MSNAPEVWCIDGKFRSVPPPTMMIAPGGRDAGGRVWFVWNLLDRNIAFAESIRDIIYEAFQVEPAWSNLGYPDRINLPDGKFEFFKYRDKLPAFIFETLDFGRPRVGIRIDAKGKNWIVTEVHYFENAIGITTRVGVCVEETRP